MESLGISSATLRFIEEHQDDDVRSLALRGGGADVDMVTALAQIAGRQAVVRKVPSWIRMGGLRYPSGLPLEQCSSEAAARYKATLLEGDTLVDLTGGLGVDCAFLARRFRRVDYVEHRADLCELARHNFPLLGLGHVGIHHAEAIDYLREMTPVDCLYLDPARRGEYGGRMVAVADCEPDVAALEPMLVCKGRRVLVKLSPMLDVSLAFVSLRTAVEAHIVAVSGECKELLLLLAAGDIPTEVPICCVDLRTDGTPAFRFSFTRESERRSPCPLTAEIAAFLYEPDVALLKAGAFRSLAGAFPVRKLHANSHLYTAAVRLPGFPGRTFRVEGVSGFGKQELRHFLQDVPQANLAVRNFPLPVVELRRRLRLKEGGEVYLFATTLADGRHVLVKGRKV